MSEVILLAKGPSALQVESLWDQKRCPVACVNDSGRLFTGGEIDYCFFYHNTGSYPRGCDAELCSRIKKFVGPASLSHLIRVKNLHTFSDPMISVDQFQSALKSGALLFHHTTLLALHWLIREEGFRVVYVLGVDGGPKDHYAPGVLQAGDSCPTDLDTFRSAFVLGAGLLEVKYNCKVII